MYIVAIAWLYVTVLMAATEATFFAGIVTFFMYGLLPCSIVMYLLGAPGRYRAIKAREAAEFEAQQASQASTGGALEEVTDAVHSAPTEAQAASPVSSQHGPQQTPPKF